jgi:hypothetical protein
MHIWNWEHHSRKTVAKYQRHCLPELFLETWRSWSICERPSLYGGPRVMVALVGEAWSWKGTFWVWTEVSICLDCTWRFRDFPKKIVWAHFLPKMSRIRAKISADKRMQTWENDFCLDGDLAVSIKSPVLCGLAPGLPGHFSEIPSGLLAGLTHHYPGSSLRYVIKN